MWRIHGKKMRPVIKRQIKIPGDAGSDDSGIMGVDCSIKKG